jgi:ketosteroid isomerase-like protein
MTRGLLILLLFSSGPLTALCRAQAPVQPDVKPDDKARTEVLQAETDEGDAILKGDIKTLDRLWSDELLYTNQKGELHTKAEHLAEFQSGVRKFDSYKHEDLRVHVYPDMVVVNGRSTSTVHDQGETSIGPRRFTNVWVKQDGNWKLVVHHVTDVVQPGFKPVSAQAAR